MEFVAESEVVQLLQAMVRANSVNPPAETTACAGTLLDLLAQEGINARQVEGIPGKVNVVASLVGERPGPKLILNGHIDTVAEGDGWSVDPFEGTEQDGFVWGRGTCDMKSGVAAMLMAMVDLKRSGKPFAGEIQLQAVADEESGSQWGTLHLIEEGYCEDADFAICTEPTSNRVELGNRGLRWVDVTVIGAASHAGRPNLGVNAIAVAAEIVRDIEELSFTIRDDRFEIADPSISVTMIQGGHTVNVIPDICTFSIDRRMLPGETEVEVVLQLQEIFNRSLREWPDARVSAEVRPGCWDPYTISPDEPIAVAAIEAARKVFGREREVGYKAACTDASHLVTRAGIPTVLFGPGNEQLSHKPDERIATESLIAGVRVYRQMFKLLLK